MSEAIKLAIVGIGRAGWGMHCEEIKDRQDKFQIVAACDIEESRCLKMAEKYSCRTYTNIKELVKDPEVEVVSIASRSTEHTEHAIIALEAGKTVFLEKPIAVNLKEIAVLEEAVKKYPGKLFFRHNRRFEPAFQHIREIITEGILGEVYEIKLRRNGYQRRNDWQTLISCGGGQLNNWGPHIVDHGLRFLESELVEIWSHLKLVAAVGDAEDHLKIILKGKNKRIVDLEISGGSAISEPEYVVSGTKGGLSCKGEEITLKYLDPKVKLQACEAKPESPPLDNSFGNAEKLQWIEKQIKVAPATGCDTDHIWDHLYEAVKNGKEFPIKAQEALQVAKVICQVKAGTCFEKPK
jgi:predicted dehydrogenase